MRDREVLLSWPEPLRPESRDTGVCLGAQDPPHCVLGWFRGFQWDRLEGQAREARAVTSWLRCRGWG